MKTDRKAARAAALLKSWPARQLALLLLLLVASHQLGRGAFGATYTIGLVASAPTAADAQAIAGVYLAVEHINSKNDSIVQKAGLMPNDFKVSVTFYDLGDQDGNVTGASVAAALLELSRSSAVGLIAGTKPPSATSQIAMFSTALHMPLLSYQGAGALQGNRGLFPYYHRVPRLCMSVAAACGRLAKELGMHRFAMLYAKNDDGHAAFEAVKQWVNVSGDADATIEGFEYQEENDASILSALTGLSESGSKNVIAALAPGSEVSVLELAMRKSMLEHSWSWILFEGDLAEALSNAPEHILQELGPAMTDAHILRVLPNLSSNFSDIEMSRLLGSLSLPVAVSARLQDYDEPLPRRAAYAYDAAWTLGLALAAAHDQQLGGSMQARILGHSRIPQISFAGASCSSEASSADMNAFSAGHSVEALVVREGREFAWMKAERIPGDAGSQLEIRTNEMLHATRRKGSDQAVSAGGSDCRMGTVFEPKGRVCAYHVALIFPCKSRHFPPSRALAAYLAVSHVNSRNGEIVGPVTAGSLGETLRIQPLLLCHDDSPSSSMEAGLSAYSTPVIAAVGGGSSQATMTILQLMEISNTPVVSYGSSSKPLSSFLMSSHLSISDEHQAVQAAKLAMESFGWCRIGVIHEDNMVGSSFFSAFKHACKWLASLRQTQASEFEIIGGPISMEAAADMLQYMKDEHVRVFVVLLPEDLMPAFLKAASALDMLGIGYSYITVDAAGAVASLVQEPGRFGLSYQEADELREKVEGLLHISTVPWITHGPNLTSDFSYHMLNVHAMIESFISSENMSDELPEVLAVLNQTASSLPDVASLFVYDAVWSLAIGLAAAENDVPGWLNGDCGALVNCHGAALSSRIRHARFSGASGNVGFIRDPISDSVFNVGAAGDRDAFAVPSSIEFYNSSARAWTTVGKLLAGSAQNGESSSLSLGQPITWPGGYASLSAPPDGASCSVGEYFSNVTLECLPCKPGYYSSERGSSTCLLCKAGEVCSHHGCSACSTCPQGSWQDGTQPTGCTLCPQNTGTAGVGAMALAECQCSAGFYRRDGLPGRVCYPCPDGGECLGSSHPPFPKLGYYGDWSMVDPGVGDSEQAASSISNSLFLKCSADWHCKNSDCIALDSATIDDDALRNGRLAECRSNVSNLCHPAYEGMMCGRCSAGYFSLGGACLKCQEPKILFTVGLIVVVVLVWYLINRIAAGRYEAVDLLLLFLQNASTISFFSLNWSNALKNGLFTWLSVVNFDVTFLTPDCLSTPTFAAWGYGHGLVLQLLLPVIVLTLTLTHLAINWAVLKIRGNNIAEDAKRQVSPSLMELGFAEFRSAIGNSLSSRNGSVCALCHFLGLATSGDLFSDRVNEAISSILTTLNALYNTLTAKCLEVFMCFPLADGSSHLRAAPDIPCWEGAHMGYVAISIMGLVLYTAFVPILYFLILEYGRVHNLFRGSRYMSRYGWLYRRYEREYYYWELTILGRRALLVVILVLAQNFAGVQIALGMCVVVTATTLHFAAQPFVSDSLDSLETFTLMSLVGLLCSGILFFGDLRQDGSPQLLLAATSLTYLSIFGCGLFVIIMVVYDVKYEEAIKKVSRRMRKSIKIVLDRCSPSGEDPLWTSSKGTNSVINSIINLFQHRSFKFSKNRVASHPESEPEKHRKSVEGDQGEEETTRDQQNTTAAEFPSQPLDRKRRRPPVKQIPNVERIRLHEKWSKLATALNAEELELHRTIKVREVMKWLNKLEEDDDEADSEPNFRQAERTRRGPSSSSLLQNGSFHHLAQVFKSKSELSCAARLGTIRFWMTNHWVKRIMADTSPVSFYSTRPYSVFFSNLVSENPYLIDYLLHASEGDLDQAKGVINNLRTAQLRFTKAGRLANLIHDVDKGPLLAWLMVASHSHKEVIKELLVDIYQANNDGRNPYVLQTHESVSNGWWTNFVDEAVRRWLPGPNTTFTFRPWKSGGTNAQLDILAAADESTSHPSFDVIHKLAELRHSEASSASRTYDVWQDAGPSSPSPGQSLEIEGCADANVPGQECSPGSMCQAGGEAKVSEARRISCASARPSGGSVIAPLAAERNTICPMPLQYCLDQEVQATFDLQRFDEEIQRLSDFSSPMEGWLHDLEQKIADEMGKVSTLNKLVQDSFYKAAAVSLEHSQRRVSPGEPGSCDYSSRRVFLSFPSSNTFDLDPCNSRTSFTQNNGSLCNHRPGH